MRSSVPDGCFPSPFGPLRRKRFDIIAEIEIGLTDPDINFLSKSDFALYCHA
jgi:hypothetical protein